MHKILDGILFNDIGKKIQLVAKIMFLVDVVASVLGGTIMFFIGLGDIEEFGFLILLAPLAIVVGCIVAWLSVATLYCFGKIAEDISAVRQQNEPVTTAPDYTYVNPTHDVGYEPNQL